MISSETIAIAAATIVGPIAAVLITRWNDRRMQRRERLHRIYRTLMATRKSAISQEHVEAINLIEVEFHDIEPVIAAWTTYLNHLNHGHPGQGSTAEQDKAFEDKRGELLAILLVKIAAQLGITKGEIEILHGGYAPQGWLLRDTRVNQIQDYLLRLSEGRAIVPISNVPPQPQPQNNPFPPPPA
jgi:hypothetical protein